MLVSKPAAQRRKAPSRNLSPKRKSSRQQRADSDQRNLLLTIANVTAVTEATADPIIRALGTQHAAAALALVAGYDACSYAQLSYEVFEDAQRRSCIEPDQKHEGVETLKHLSIAAALTVPAGMSRDYFLQRAAALYDATRLLGVAQRGES